MDVRWLIGGCMVAALTAGCSIGRSVTSKISVDARAASAAAKPILYLDTDGVNAVYADGRRVKISLPYTGKMPASSPDGLELAYLAGPTNRESLHLKSVQGATRTVFTFAKDGVAAELTWSPDGRKIAVLVKEGAASSFSIVLIGIPEQKILLRRELPVSATKGADKFGRPKLAWSPDGQKILLAANTVLIIDSRDGSIEEFAEHPLLVEWAPDSNGIYYFSCEGVLCNVPGDLYFRPLKVAQPIKLKAKDEINALGITRAPALGFDPLVLSPSGSRMVIWGSSVLSERGRVKGATCDIHIYDMRKETRSNLDKPSRTFRTKDLCVAVDWSPDDGYSLAVVGVADEPRGIGIRLLNIESGEWRTLVKIQLTDETHYAAYLYGFRVMRWTR